MGRAQSFALDDRFGALNGRPGLAADGLHFRANDDEKLHWLQGPNCLQHMSQQTAPGSPVQHLRQAGFHPRPQAGGENNSGDLGHRICASCINMLICSILRVKRRYCGDCLNAAFPWSDAVLTGSGLAPMVRRVREQRHPMWARSSVEEHLTFNQRVVRSIRTGLTNNINHLDDVWSALKSHGLGPGLGLPQKDASNEGVGEST